MKRIMFMLAVTALMVVGANAGQIQWTFAGAKSHSSLLGSVDGATTLNNGSQLGGVIAYLFIGALDAAGTATAIQNGTFSTASAVANATTLTNGGTGTQYYGSYTSGSYTCYVVAFDGTYSSAGEGNYWISSAITRTFSPTGNQAYTWTMTTTTNWTHYNNVPEPTSMALLALGAAAVGLRRKFRK